MEVSKGIFYPSSAVAHNILHLELERVLLRASLDNPQNVQRMSARKPVREHRGLRHLLRNLLLVIFAVLAASLTAAAQSTLDRKSVV